MGGAQCGTQFLTNPHRDCLNLSSLLSTRCCLRSARLSIFCFLLHYLFRLFFYCSLLLVLFSVCSWLKANLSLTIHFLFYPFGSPIVVRLEFRASASSPTSHREVATCPLINYASSSSMVWYFQLHSGMTHPPNQWSNQTSDFYMPWLNSPIKSSFSIRHNLSRQIWSPQILWCSLISHGWLARPLAHDER